MIEMIVEFLRDTSAIEWWMIVVLPMLGGMSGAQMWKQEYRFRNKVKPPNHRVQFVAALFCTFLSTLAQGLAGTRGWHAALGVGIAIGPAAPLLWWVGIRLFPERVSRAMRGGRDPDRDPIILTSWERQQLLNDSMFGDGDTTIQDKIRELQAQREKKRRAERGDG